MLKTLHWGLSSLRDSHGPLSGPQDSVAYKHYTIEVQRGLHMRATYIIEHFLVAKLKKEKETGGIYLNDLFTPICTKYVKCTEGRQK